MRRAPESRRSAAVRGFSHRPTAVRGQNFGGPQTGLFKSGAPPTDDRRRLSGSAERRASDADGYRGTRNRRQRDSVGEKGRHGRPTAEARGSVSIERCECPRSFFASSNVCLPRSGRRDPARRSFLNLRGRRARPPPSPPRGEQGRAGRNEPRRRRGFNEGPYDPTCPRQGSAREPAARPLTRFHRPSLAVGATGQLRATRTGIAPRPLTRVRMSAFAILISTPPPADIVSRQLGRRKLTAYSLWKSARNANSKKPEMTRNGKGFGCHGNGRRVPSRTEPIMPR